MKIRIIDLLNKIYNNDNIPKRFFYNSQVWQYDDATNDFKNEVDGSYLLIDYINFYSTVKDFLESELEIIETHKKIENVLFEKHYDGDGKCYLQYPDSKFKYYIPSQFIDKINEIIDVVNKLVEDNEY